MAEAWINRGAERQALLSSLKRETYEAAESDPRFMSLLLTVLISALEEKSNILTPVIQGDPVRLFYTIVVFPQIASFSRCDEERHFLISQFMMWVAESIHSGFQQKLMSIEISDPQKVFRTISAMAEVEQ
jgi:hypothetical protein